MGQLIFNSMIKNGIPLEKKLFIFGNLAPDILITYVFNPHTHSNPKCHSRLNKLLKLLYKTSVSNRLKFSYYSGVAAHYICDFVCYAHTPVFEGGVREHLSYEKNQAVTDKEMLPFFKQDSMFYSLSELIRTLDERISKRVQLLSNNAEMSFSDIPIAINIASWATSAAYHHIEKSSQCRRHISFYSHGHRKTA